MGLREKILAASDIKFEDVPVPEWDCTLRVKGMNGTRRSKLLEDTIDKTGQVDMAKFYPEIVAMTACDPETDEPIFTLDDVEALGNKSGAVMELLASTAMKLSGMTKVDAKNLSSIPSAVSISS